METVPSNLQVIREEIIRDMSEGVMAIGLHGEILFLNPAALRILGRTEDQLLGRRFGVCFFDDERNDEFTQAVLNAVYDKTRPHSCTAPYTIGEETRQLFMVTAFLKHQEEQVGIVVVLSDITEVEELRDAIKAMDKIRELNTRLELRNQLLSETFGRFLSDEIVRQLLETPDGLALGGRKQVVTILMSDLRGFTALSERMGADRLITMLNHYLGEMTEIIQRRNGTIIEFIGDGIFAVFGAPTPSETHAAEAIAAAVEMEARMDAVNQWNREQGFPALEMGIGINTGEVIVGNIGSEKRTKYGVVGNEVNICGRIESYTVGGQILISPETRRQNRAELEIADEWTVYPKGVKGSLLLTHVVGIGAPYRVSCHRREEQMEVLAQPVPVRFRMMDGKHGTEQVQTGRLTAQGETGAVLETACPLALFDNLLLTDTDRFCKVVRRREDGWVLRFTSGKK